MSRTHLSPLLTITFIAVSALLGFYNVCISSAFAPTAEANPRLIYWPPTVVERQGDYIIIGNGRIEAKSIAWSPSGRYLLVYGRVYEYTPYTPPSDTYKALIVDMESGTLAYNFSIDVGQLVWDNFVQFAFSPDETKIFYVKLPTLEYIPQIFSVNLDGTNATFITYMNSTSTSIRKPFLIDVVGAGFLIYSDCETTYNITSGQYNYTNLFGSIT